MPYFIFLLFWWVINCQTAAQNIYDEYGEHKYGYTPVRKGQFWGVLDSTNRLVAACQYKNAQVVTFGCDITGLLLDGDYCFIGKDSLRCYHQLYGYENGYARASKNGLQGYVDKAGVEVVPCEYLIPNSFEHKYTFIMKQNGKRGIMTLNPPRIVIPVEYNSISYNEQNTNSKLSNTFYLRKGNEMGIVDTNNKVIIPVEYKNIKNWGNSMLVVSKDSTYNIQKIGVCDAEHHFLLPISDYVVDEKLYNYTNDCCLLLKKGDKYGVFNWQLKVIVPFEYDMVYYLSNRKIIVKKNDKMGLVDMEGKQLLACVYDDLYYLDVEKKILSVKKDGYYGVLDEEGKIILPFDYEEFSRCYNNQYIVKKNAHYGLLNRDMQEILPIAFDKISIEGDYFLIKDGKKWGVLKEKNIIWLPKGETYTKLQTLWQKKLLLVQQKQQNGALISGIIDTTGKVILPFSKKIATIERVFDLNTIIASKNDKKRGLLYGVINVKGHIKVPIQYESIIKTEKNFLVKKNGKIGLINYSNKTLIPAIYDTIQFLTSNNRDIIYYLVSINKKKNILNNEYQLVTPTSYDSIAFIEYRHEFYSYGRFIAIEKDKKIIIDRDGKEISFPFATYDHIIPRADGYYDVNKGGSLHNFYNMKHTFDGQWGLLSPEGKLLTPINSFIQMGRIGNVFVSTKAVFNSPINNDSTVVVDNKLSVKPNHTVRQLLDSSGNVIQEYEILYPTKHKTTMVQIGQKIGAIDENGKEIIPLVLDDIKTEIEYSWHSFHIVAKNGKWGVLDSAAKWLVEPQYSDILLGELDPYDYLPRNTLRYCVGRVVDVCEKRETVHGKWGVMTTGGKILTPPLYKNIEGFYDGYSRVTIEGDPDAIYKDDLYGVIDSTGKSVVAPVYKNVSVYFPYFVHLIDTSNKQGLQSLQGKCIMPCRFNSVVWLEKGRMALIVNDSVYIINHKGKKIGSFKHNTDSLVNMRFGDNTFLIIGKHKTTVFDLDTHRKRTFKLSSGHYIKNIDPKTQFTTVIHNNVCGLINRKGKEIVPYQYETITIDKKHKRIIASKTNTSEIYTYKGKKVRAEPYIKNYFEPKQALENKRPSLNRYGK